MKKIILILIIVLMSSSVFAYVKPIDYKGVKIKFYDEKITESNCFPILDKIPEEYFYGITFIRFYNRIGKDMGYYHIDSKMIDDFSGCSEETVVHELAHHCQAEWKDTRQELIDHTGNFKICEDEIKKYFVKTETQQKTEEKKPEKKQVITSLSPPTEKKESLFLMIKNWFKGLFR